MAWNLSTGAKKALLACNPSAVVSKIGEGISFGDGDGAGGRDTINDTENELASFGVHDSILIIGGTFNNVLITALSVAAGKIEVKAGTFTAVAAGAKICLVKIASGSFAQVFRNSVMDGFEGMRPVAGADAAESGTKLITITKNGGAFVAGASANGLNVGEFSGTTLQRAIDPETGELEQWRGAGLVAGTVGHMRWYANDKTTGASAEAIRMDGVVAPSGADVNLLTGTSIAVGVYSEVSSVNLTMTGV